MRLLVKQIVCQHHVEEGTKGKARKPLQPGLRVRRALALPLRVQVSQHTSTCSWEPPRPSRAPHPAVIALSLTTVWPTRTGFGSRTQGLQGRRHIQKQGGLRATHSDYKYPPGCHPNSNHNDCSLVGNRSERFPPSFKMKQGSISLLPIPTSLPPPICTPTKQSAQQPDMVKILKYASEKLGTLTDPISHTSFVHTLTSIFLFFLFLGG